VKQERGKGAANMGKYQVISEERNNIGSVLFEGSLEECRTYARMYQWNVFPSLKFVN